MRGLRGIPFSMGCSVTAIELLLENKSYKAAQLDELKNVGILLVNLATLLPTNVLSIYIVTGLLFTFILNVCKNYWDVQNNLLFWTFITIFLDFFMMAAPLLLCSVTGSLVAVWAVLHSLYPEDRISLVQGLCLMALGFIFFISSFDLGNFIMFHTAKGKKWKEKYKLGLYDVMDISNKIVSAIQAVLSSICGTIVCNFSCPRNMLRTSHFMSQAYAWFGASYFLYDVYSMFVIHNLSPKTINRLKLKIQTKENENSQIKKVYYFFKLQDFILHQPLIIIHHLFIGLFGFLVVVHLRKNFGDCVFGFIFLMELSTPFVSFRGILSRLQLKQSKIYLVNGIIMITVFFICRIFLFIFLFKYYSQFIEASILEAILTLPTVCQTSLLILILPQLYWFSIMLKGAFSLFSSHLSCQNSKISSESINDSAQHTDVNGEQKKNLVHAKVH